MCDVVFQRYPCHKCLARRVLVEIMSTWTESLTRSRQSFARLCVVIWTTYNTSAKRHGPYSTYTLMRAADVVIGMSAKQRRAPAGGKGLI